MCIMCLKRADQEFSAEYIETIYSKGNNDGFGLAYVDGERNGEGKLVKPGRVKAVKSMGGPTELKEIYEEHKDKNLIMHLRNATAGDKNLENCHPYWILNIDDGDPIDLVMMHNGTIDNVQVDRKMSDSYNFATLHLRGILKSRPSMLYEEGFRYFLCSLMKGNKLMFLDNRERVTVINYEMGSIHPGTGVWLSTKDNLQLPKPAPASKSWRTGTTSSNNSGTSHIGSLPPHVSDKEHVVIPKISWAHKEGSKWVMEPDGRSHLIPAVAQQDILTKDGLDEEKIKDLLSKAAGENTTEALEAVRKSLEKASQTELQTWAQEFPAESAYLIKYIADTTDLFPEFKESSLEELVVYCLDQSWQAGFALAVATRREVKLSKEAVYEVN